MNTTRKPIAHETIGTERLLRTGRGDVLLWGSAFFIMLAMQASGAVLLVNWRSEPELPGAPPPAIMIELSEISVAPRVEDIAAENGEIALAQEAAQAAELTPEPVDTLDPIETVEPIEQTEAVEPLEQETIEEVIPDIIEAETAELYVPMPVTRPVSIEQKRTEFAEAQKRERQAQERRKREQAAAAASRQTAPQSVEANAAERSAAAEQTTTTRRTPTISPQQWQSQVIAHLNRAKRYPADARSRREEGIPHLQFTIDPAGNVLSARVVGSSGYPALDQAAIDMINRASPVPAPPASMAQNRLTLTVPINFNLR